MVKGDKPPFLTPVGLLIGVIAVYVFLLIADINVEFLFGNSITSELGDPPYPVVIIGIGIVLPAVLVSLNIVGKFVWDKTESIRYIFGGITAIGCTAVAVALTFLTPVLVSAAIDTPGDPFNIYVLVVQICIYVSIALFALAGLSELRVMKFN
ncbi:MAG: hypothetical protein ACFFCS_03555 [Candidatus Hodarchaeota archaeon]